MTFSMKGKALKNFIIYFIYRSLQNYNDTGRNEPWDKFMKMLKARGMDVSIKSSLVGITAITKQRSEILEENSRLGVPITIMTDKVSKNI